ncbi:hypothetical protein [Candidatus Similichlamydia laticola]|uniref:Uncharacterized protein n=1 Tax=Candidatus Similichlamydia laticola TaxID=2170265 RepID=A0A369KB95_9BACT|nr:hypothetical protein [Candidatus Similichlamydia laticola]RDB31188.1 hypothetical protein HAT2_00668 [Candidatus Similichlamydia laticola]
MDSVTVKTTSTGQGRLDKSSSKGSEGSNEVTVRVTSVSVELLPGEEGSSKVEDSCYDKCHGCEPLGCCYSEDWETYFGFLVLIIICIILLFILLSTKKLEEINKLLGGK